MESNKNITLYKYVLKYIIFYIKGEANTIKSSYKVEKVYNKTLTLNPLKVFDEKK